MNRAEFMKKFGIGLLGTTIGLKVADKKIKKVKVAQITSISDDVTELGFNRYLQADGSSSSYPMYASMAVTYETPTMADRGYMHDWDMSKKKWIKRK